MNQHKNLKRIWELESLLHKIQSKPNKELERKVINKELDQLSKQIKER